MSSSNNEITNFDLGGPIHRMMMRDSSAIEVTFDIKSKIHHSNDDLELMYFRISAANQKPVDTFLIYRPPSGNVANAVNHIKNIVAEVSNNTDCTEIVIIGDIHIDLLKRTSDSCRKVTDIGRALNLEQLIQDPTRNTKTTSTLIDVFSKSGVLEWNVSDHLPIFLI